MTAASRRRVAAPKARVGRLLQSIVELEKSLCQYVIEHSNSCSCDDCRPLYFRAEVRDQLQALRRQLALTARTVRALTD